MKKESFKTSKPEPYNFSNNINSLELNLYNAETVRSTVASQAIPPPEYKFSEMHTCPAAH